MAIVMPQPQPQLPRSQARQNGPSREPQGRPVSGSNFNSAFSHRNFIQHDALSLAADPVHHWATEFKEHQYSYESLSIDVDRDIHRCSRYNGTYNQAHERDDRSHKIPRTQQIVKPEVLRVVNDPRLRYLGDHSRHAGSSRHSASQTRNRQHQPAPSEHYLDQIQDRSRPLGYSNLRELDLKRPKANALERRLWLHQHDEPYDAVGYVGRQSDYERRYER